MLDVAEREGVSELTHVLCTHNHWDHAGGNADMVALRQGITVVGGRGDGVQAVTKEVSVESVINIASHPLSFARSLSVSLCHSLSLSQTYTERERICVYIYHTLPFSLISFLRLFQ